METALKNLENQGFKIEHSWTTQLNDSDDIPDGIDRLFINGRKDGVLWALVWDFRTQKFTTQVELWNDLYGTPGEWVE